MDTPNYKLSDSEYPYYHFFTNSINLYANPKHYHSIDEIIAIIVHEDIHRIIHHLFGSKTLSAILSISWDNLAYRDWFFFHNNDKPHDLAI